MFAAGPAERADDTSTAILIRGTPANRHRGDVQDRPRRPARTRSAPAGPVAISRTRRA